MDQSVSRGRVGGLESHGQGTQAAFGGSAKGLAAVEQVLVEVEADVCLQTLWETLQHLRVKHGSEQTRAVRRGSGSLDLCQILLLVKLGKFPENYDTVATCVRSFISKPFSRVSSRRETRRTNSKQRLSD